MVTWLDLITAAHRTRPDQRDHLEDPDEPACTVAGDGLRAPIRTRDAEPDISGRPLSVARRAPGGRQGGARALAPSPKEPNKEPTGSDPRRRPPTVRDYFRC